MSFDNKPVCLACGGPAPTPHGLIQCTRFLKTEIEKLKTEIDKLKSEKCILELDSAFLKETLLVYRKKLKQARDERNALIMRPDEPCKGCSFSNYGEACQYKKVCVPRQQYYQYWSGIEPEQYVKIY